MTTGERDELDQPVPRPSGESGSADVEARAHLLRSKQIARSVPIRRNHGETVTPGPANYKDVSCLGVSFFCILETFARLGATLLA